MSRQHANCFQVCCTDLLDCLQIVVAIIEEALSVLAQLEDGQLLHHSIGKLQQARSQAQQSEVGGQHGLHCHYQFPRNIPLSMTVNGGPLDCTNINNL